MIDANELSKILPNLENADEWLTALQKWLPAYEIDTPTREADFIAQTTHESADYTALSENLHYSVKGLRRVFKKYFPTDELAAKYANKPEAIANRVYANRMGNGDEASGDGWKFRGKGLIQLTGHDNHKAFADSIGMTIDGVVEYLGTIEGAVHSACWFWKEHGLNKFADTNSVKTITQRINGGDIGLEDRIARTDADMEILSA